MKAAVFIDVQKDFIVGGSLAYGYPAKDIVPDIIDFSRDCRSKGYALYATADTHKPSYDSQTTASNDGGYKFTLEGHRLPVEHCILKTMGHEFADGLTVDSVGDVVIPRGNVIYKETFGTKALADKIQSDFCCDTYGKTIGFMRECNDVWTGNGEPLDEILVCGFCTSICVVSNVLMLRAQFPNVKITVFEDLCGDIDQASHEAALKVLVNCQIDVKRWKD